eukprot:TRINITY_DN603_c1_g3_i1.p1 TRINITY_DN603_c1_g3~~TRINITY_DN603_c1_g3_i1.p1  ORF type:complete len:709 (+),score=161.50 TRINITY_DN603_c1_g3_i1:35-2128(+)
MDDDSKLEVVSAGSSDAGGNTTTKTTWCDAFRETAKASETRVALRFRQSDRFEEVKWGEYYKRCREVARAFLAVDKHKHKHKHHGVVHVCADNRPEWLYVHAGAAMAGLAPCGVPTSFVAADCARVLRRCGPCRLVFVDTEERCAKYEALQAEFHHLTIVRFGEVEVDKSSRAMSWSTFLELGVKVEEGELDDCIAAQHAENLCELVIVPDTCTSTEDGEPPSVDVGEATSSASAVSPVVAEHLHGVMLSHANVTAAAACVAAHFGITRDDSTVSFLPLNYIGSQLIYFYVPTLLGCCVTFAPADAMKLSAVLVESLKEAKPTTFFGVPRTWEKLQDYLRQIFEFKSSLGKSVGKWANNKGAASAQAKVDGGRPPKLFGVARKVSLLKSVAALGLGSARVCVTGGGSSVHADTLQFFHTLGMIIFELYGTSEATGVVTASSCGTWRPGTCGTACGDVHVRLADDGEILVTGPNIFMGYYGEEDTMNRTMDAGEATLHTGDLAEWVQLPQSEKTVLSLRGRKRSLLVTSGGEHAAPEPIERALCAVAPAVLRAVLIGEGKPFLCALLVVGDACNVGDAEFSESLRSCVEALNDRTNAAHQVKKFAAFRESVFTRRVGGILPAVLTMEDRRGVETTFAATIARLYSQTQAPTAVHTYTAAGNDDAGKALEDDDTDTTASEDDDDDRPAIALSPSLSDAS